MVKKSPKNFENTQVPLVNRTDKILLAQPKFNPQSVLKSTPDSLKQRLKAFERKRSLGAPDY